MLNTVSHGDGRNSYPHENCFEPAFLPAQIINDLINPFTDDLQQAP
ncbi:MAG: hypothetical protein AB7O96_02410 [Pseudobdellovibrionaceae bacterium]